MTILPIHLELHTTPLTAECLMSVKLREEGKAGPECASALYRGNVGHALMEAIIGNEITTPSHLIDLMPKVVERARAKLTYEGRITTDAVDAHADKIHAEILDWCQQYVERFSERRFKCETIGVEVPIRHTFIVDGAPHAFASHLDDLMWDHHGVWGMGSERLVCFDWKFRDEPATAQYVSRNMQLVSYCLALSEGEVLVDPNLDFWDHLDDWPACAFLNMPQFKVYQKAVRGVKWDDKTVRDVKKGDRRPDRAILKWARHRMDRKAFMEAEIATRIRMIRANLWPTNPGPQRCIYCDVEPDCPRFDIASTDNEPEHDDE